MAFEKKLNPLDPTQQRLLRSSLIFVWLSTALVSSLEHQGQGLALLTRAGIDDPFFANTLIWTGVATDTLLGFALWKYPSRTTYITALAMMLLMTLVATMLDPGLWWHPLGPLTKNVPIGAALWLLAKSEA